MGKIEEIFVNGVNADGTVGYEEQITPEVLFRAAKGQPLSKDERDTLKTKKHQKDVGAHYGVVEGVDPNDLSSAGWSIVFPADLPQKSLDGIKDALKPLLDHRKKQVGELYREVSGKEGVANGETKGEFLKRFKKGPGPAQPDLFPYYVLLAGSPESISYGFQYQLDIQYAVGRLYFEKLEDYYQYAISVVEAETKKLARAKRTAFYGVQNPDDRATEMSAAHLIKPLVDSGKTQHEKWGIDHITPDKASKSTLASYLGGDKTPALLFTASHGMNFKQSDSRQLKHQGALVTGEWPGPKARKPVTPDMYFSAEDIANDADVFGMIAFFFACYGGGTPKMDNFYKQAFGDPRQIAPWSFVAQLPQRLLSHPRGGALGVFAHVERAWGSSIVWDGSVADVATFDSTIGSLLNGETAGMATEYFNERYAEISSELTVELEKEEEEQDMGTVASLWTSNNDARNYAFLGDPAVRLAVADKETPKLQREKLGSIVTKHPASVTKAAVSFQPDVEVSTPPADPAQPTASTAQPAFGGIFGGGEKEQPAQKADLSDTLKQFADKLGAYLSKALDDATSLEITTYVADEMDNVQYQGGKFSGAKLRALTRINIDGDTMVVLPKKDGEVDTEVWAIHLDMVKQAQEGRAELMKTMVSAVSGLTSIIKK